PSAVLGHSVGEYAAACVAGVFSLEDGLRLIARRGRLMGALPGNGGMAAVLASEERVSGVIGPYAHSVSIAAVNGPESVVVSGERQALEAVCAVLQAQGVRTTPLRVSHAFHSPLMDPVLADFESVAQQIDYAPPQVPIISNVTGAAIGEEIAAPAYWRRHLRQPVRFAAGMVALAGRGCNAFVEIGPQPTLLGLGRQCLTDDALWLPSLRQGRDNWQTLLDSLAALYIHGAAVDWAGFDRDYRRRRVALPAYPFQRRRYWLDPPRSEAPREPKLHPLLDKKIRSPLLKETLFETRLHVEAQPFLADHRVYDQVVVSGACHMAMALAAAESVFGSAALEDVVFARPLVVPEAGCTVQLVITPQAGGAAAFRLISLGADPESWTGHVTGRIVAAPATAAAVEPPERAWSRCHREITADEFLETQRRRHIHLGPAYHWLAAVRCGCGEAVGRIGRPASETAGRYPLHPGLIDAGFGLLAAAQSAAVAESFVPFRIGRVRVHGRPDPDAPLWGHCRLHAAGDRQLGDIVIADAAGRALMEFQDFEGRQAGAGAFQAGQSLASWLYEVEWQPCGRPAAVAGDLAAPPAIARQLESKVAAAAAELAFYADFRPRMDALSAAWLLAALRRLGWQWRPGQRFAPDAFADALGIAGRQRRLLGRLLEILAEEGLIRAENGHWQVMAAPEPEDPAALHKALLARHPAMAAELDLLARCGSRLDEVLQDRCDPLALLLPGNDLEPLTRFYADSPCQGRMNALLHQAVAAAASRPLRLLEIGAGTGATTAGLLPRLPADHTEYVFTDVSPLFVARARQRLAAWPFVRYQTLDIEQPPAAQGFAGQVYDVVIAANVLHATRDLGAALEYVNSLLAPGGLLVLMESTARQRWVDLTFGLTDGWWRFADRSRRPDHPLLAAAQWQTLLDEKGFAETAVLSPEPGLGLHQAVILARRPAAGARRWLVLADRGGVGQRLAARLKAQGGACTLIPADRELQDIPPGLHGVVHCRSLDAAAVDLEAAGRQGCGSLLALVQALAAAGAAPSLFIVTRGALAVAGRGPNVAQSPVWGMGKVIALEHPELNPVRLDLDPEDDDPVRTLLAELDHGGGEDQVAYRDRTRHVARLVRAGNENPGRMAFRADASYLITGGLGGLGLRLARWLVEQNVRHLVLAGRHGPGPAAGEAIKALEQAGAQVRVVAADVADAGQVAGLMEETERSLPPLRGVFHAAGVLDDALLVNQTWERFAKVLAAKVQGAWNLHALTARLPLDCFVLFSSAASLLGNRGQASHAAGNAFLDALAGYRRSQGLTALSINWGAWSEIGAAAAIRADQRLRGEGLGSLSPQQGLHALEQVLSRPTAQIGVLPIDWARIAPHWTRSPFFAHFRQPEPARPAADFAASLKTLPAGQRRARLAEHLQSQVSQVLGGGDGRAPIGVQQGFFDFGMDSLTAVELRNRLQASLGCALPSTVLFTCPTVADLADYLLAEVFGNAAPAEAGTDAEDAFAYLDEISHEALEALVNRELESE
nr:SDR family NAD(P)-dependent oxidoreductase [Pseudomonadota bacterium]